MAAACGLQNLLALPAAVGRNPPAWQTWPAKFSSKPRTTAWHPAVSAWRTPPPEKSPPAPPVPPAAGCGRIFRALHPTFPPAPSLPKRIEKLFQQRPAHESRSRRNPRALVGDHVGRRRLHRYLFPDRDVLLDEAIE